MSYIRCLSNPEGLYIWGNRDGTVTVTGKKFEAFSLPTRTFEGLCRKYARDGGWNDKTIYKDASVSYEMVGGHFRSVFRYQDKKVVMWEVTWWAITSRFELEDARRSERARIRKAAKP
jgi:hypothetical protein